jgi:lysophospholipase L1-like esterase
MNKEKRRALYRNCGLVLLSLLFAVLFMEAVLRLFSPVDLRLMGWNILLPVYKRYVIESPKAEKLEPRIVHNKNNLGFRGPSPPRDFDKQLSMIAVGGSTTECFVLADGRDWPAVLGQKLGTNFRNIWLNNAGMNGHTTFGHTKLLEQHILKLKPKILLFLIGINDATFAENSPKFDTRLDPGSEKDWDMKITTFLHDSLATKSHLVAFLSQAVRQIGAVQEGLVSGEVDFAKIYKTPRPLTGSQKRATADRFSEENYGGFEIRVRRLIALARNHGVVPVFITQPLLSGDGTDPTAGFPLSSLQGENFYKTELLNRELLRIGRETNVFVIDLAATLPKDSKFYYDPVHYTNLGAERVADILYSDLCPFIGEKFSAYRTKACPLPNK